MSTSLSPRSSGSSGHPTRQQLDELDALLQRMLALPVNQADGHGDRDQRCTQDDPAQAGTVLYHTVADDAPRGRSNRKASTANMTRTLPRPTKLPNDVDNAVPLSSTSGRSLHTWKPLAQSWQQSRVKPPAQKKLAAGPRRTSRSRQARPTMPPPKPAAIEETPSASVVVAKSEPKPILVPTPPPVPAQVAEEPPLPLWMEPLVWFNRAFDYLLLPWGLPGRWLRRDGRGRASSPSASCC